MSAERTTRLQWADAAKGLCIFLVVLHHTIGKHYAQIAPDLGLPLDVWEWLDDAAKPLRMPLFFLLSGVFAASSLARPWRDVVRRRLASPYYLYVVWLLVQWAVFSVATELVMNRTHGVAELAVDLLVASTGVWYLYALAAYFLLARLLFRLDHRLVLLAAGALSAYASLLPIDEANRTSLVQHFVFFALGAYYPALAAKVSALRGRWILPALAAGYVALLVLLQGTGLPLSTLTMLVSPVAIPLAIRCAMAVSGVPRLGAATAAVGRRTLPIYVLHVIVLAIVHASVRDLSGPLVAAAYPILVAGVITAVCLAVHAAAEGTPLRFLFALPDRGTPSSRRSPQTALRALTQQ